jgi:hypothetical protein
MNLLQKSDVPYSTLVPVLLSAALIQKGFTEAEKLCSPEKERRKAVNIERRGTNS